MKKRPKEMCVMPKTVRMWENQSPVAPPPMDEIGPLPFGWLAKKNVAKPARTKLASQMGVFAKGKFGP